MLTPTDEYKTWVGDRLSSGGSYVSFAEYLELNPEAKARGLGDTIAKITHALHIPQCGGCKKREELLNGLVPYGD